MTVLILEDEPLIAIDLQDSLQRLGYCAVTFASLREARAWLDGNRADLAVVDFKLRDGNCSSIVSKLTAKEVPVILHTGRDEGADGFGPEFAGVPIFKKPADTARLVSAIEQQLAVNQGAPRLHR